MKTTHRATLVLTLAAFVVPGLLLLGAQAQEPSASASSSASASASASAPDKPPPPDDSKLRALHKAPPPDGTTAAPTPEEWNSAERVALLGKLPDTCRAFMVREWLQIRCDESGVAVSIISGSKEEVSATLIPLGFQQQFTPVDGSSELQLPIRRGDRRILQLTTGSFESYNGMVSGRMLFSLSIQWLDDQPGPWVTVGQDMSIF